MFISQLAIDFLLVLAIYVATPLLLLVGLSRLSHLLEVSKLSPVHVYIAGCVSGIVLVPILVYILKFAARCLFVQKDETDHALYRLDHGILNIDMPPKTLWMNMGYWKDTSDFPAACCALLNELLVSAGILGREGVPPTDLSNDTPLKLVDLGFGCGDQSIYLTQRMKRTSRRNVDKVDHQPRRIFDAYVGMTISRPQYEFACSRLYSNHDLDKTKIRLYCADAATPQFWSKDIHEVMQNPQTEQGIEFATSSLKYTTWVLALDTLYHFIPSREHIFSYAFKELHASIMAFDLLLSDKPSIWDLILLRIVSRFTGTPFSNFLTVAQYKSQLVAAGYDSSKIDIRDISEHVFSGIASFIERRDGELKIIGLGAGRYKVAGKVFKWWARTGIIRGCIVIARR